MAKPRVLLIGWDAADWKVIQPLLDAGEMPNLARLIAGGLRGNIATLYPALSPMLWTSIATGKRCLMVPACDPFPFCRAAPRRFGTFSIKMAIARLSRAGGRRIRPNPSTA
jgi:hypothetical protein